MSRLTRDGTAELVSRDQILRRERGQGNLYFSCSADHEQDWQPYPVDPCVCVFSSRLFWTSSSLDVPAGVTQEEGHIGFLIHLPSAVRALIFLARRIQSFLFPRRPILCTNDSFVLHFLGFFFLVRKNPVYRDSNSRPNVSEGYEVTSELPGRPATSLAICVTVQYLGTWNPCLRDRSSLAI